MHSYKIFSQGQNIEKASRALILLHGRGSTATDILSLASKFCDESYYIAAPQATHNSWYPHSFMTEEKLNEPWLSSAIEVVKKLIDEISLSIPKNQIYVMGFSQGACLALESTTRVAAEYGGIIAFTGGLIGEKINPEKYRGNFAGTKVFIGNSDHDPHVPLERSQKSKELMEKMGAQVTLKIYPGMAHIINQDEIDSVNHIFFHKS